MSCRRHQLKLLRKGTQIWALLFCCVFCFGLVWHFLKIIREEGGVFPFIVFVFAEQGFAFICCILGGVGCTEFPGHLQLGRQAVGFWDKNFFSVQQLVSEHLDFLPSPGLPALCCQIHQWCWSCVHKTRISHGWRIPPAPEHQVARSSFSLAPYS